MPGYILYFGYPFSLASEEFEEKLARLVGQPASGSGMGLSGRDIDFEMATLDDCHCAIRAACQLLPQGSTVWAFHDHEVDNEPEFAIEQVDLHAFKCELDAADLTRKTSSRPQARKRHRL